MSSRAWHDRVLRPWAGAREDSIAEGYDVAVIGLGAIGSAAAGALAERGHSVVGLDRYVPPHAMGSSHGETRMIREAYYQGSLYLPLVRAAYAGWAALERRFDRRLLDRTGALMIGPVDGVVYGGCRRTATENGLPHEDLGPDEIAERFPAFRLEPGMRAVLEPNAGILALTECLRTMLDRALAAGCEIRAGERATGWTVSGRGVTVTTEAGEHTARRLVVAAGPWASRLLSDLDLPLEVERTVQYWFRPVTAADAPRFERGRCPPWVWEYGPRLTWYGFPATARGVKLGMHVEAERLADPDTICRDVTRDETRLMRGVLGRFMPAIDGQLSAADVCMYTNAPGERFFIDRHPGAPEVAFFAGGSGHAFKFAPVLGEVLADLATDAEPALDLSPFALDRSSGP